MNATLARLSRLAVDLCREPDALLRAAFECPTRPSSGRPRGANLIVPGFPIRVRPVTLPERVIRVPATGKETILEGLAHAAEDMAIKPQALSVWLVRDKAILTVDLVAILQKGNGKTNFPLEAGDQLFVQMRVAK